MTTLKQTTLLNTNVTILFLSSLYLARTQTVTGEVAYNGIQSVTFCKANGNDQFILEPSAVVTTTAPTSITFNTGFHVKAGASFSAKIVNSNGGRKTNIEVLPTTPINYARSSGFSKNRHTYAQKIKINTLFLKEEERLTTLFSVYPTVSSGLFKVTSKNSTQYKIEVVNSLGQTVIKQTQSLEQFDIKGFAHGFYFVRITSDNKSYIFKILKE